eukprot:6111469-Pyramimonas_sp.AAC.1
MRHPELTGADADAEASKMVADMFVSLRGALAYALITHVWLMVHAVSPHSVQEPTNIQMRRLNATTRERQACLEKIAYQAMTSAGEVNLRNDSGCRRLSGDAGGEIKSKAMVFAGQTCYGAQARHLASLSFTCSTRTSSLTACEPA